MRSPCTEMKSSPHLLQSESPHAATETQFKFKKLKNKTKILKIKTKQKTTQHALLPPRATLSSSCVTYSCPETLSPVPLHTLHTAVSSFTSLTDNESPLRLGLGVPSLRKPFLNASRAILHVTAIPCDCNRASRLYCLLAGALLPGASPAFPSLLSSSSSLASHQLDRCPSHVSPSLTT